jgi:acetyltransferase-like isoleucine patch superfamily enzyme
MGTRERSVTGTYIDKNAIVAKTARIGAGTRIWAFAQVGEGARIGKNCVIGNGAYIDRKVIVGDNVKIHNKALLYNGVVVEDDCFIGPGACFTNDKNPCFDKTRDLRGVSWRLKKGASVGANVTVLPDVTIGAGAVIGAGSVVTKNVPAGVTVCGNPARILKK